MYLPTLEGFDWKPTNHGPVMVGTRVVFTWMDSVLRRSDACTYQP